NFGSLTAPSRLSITAILRPLNVGSERDEKMGNMRTTKLSPSPQCRVGTDKGTSLGDCKGIVAVPSMSGRNSLTMQRGEGRLKVAVPSMSGRNAIVANEAKRMRGDGSGGEKKGLFSPKNHPPLLYSLFKVLKSPSPTASLANLLW
ncbi:MAG: hypothetical protein ACK40X_04980, partial [Armatimonadota bacterium]